MASLSFKPKQVVKRLLTALPERARKVLISRYGLSGSSEQMTLEAIGKTYGITRERVRQIENYAFAAIRKSEAHKKEKNAFDELQGLLQTLGCIISEDECLRQISKDKNTQNHIYFMLMLGESFKKRKADEHFVHRWHVDDKTADKIEGAIHKLYENLSDDQLIPESEMIAAFLDNLKDISEDHRNGEVAKRWLSLSKRVGRNPLGEWGRSASPNVKAKGMRDFAYLAIRRHGSPMHFTEVAKAIQKLFDRKAHVATTHNELIKDKRFVLVGRGLYALSEWGYQGGVVRDVIKEILKKNGPLTKDEIIQKVLKERYVKENTIAVNLQNSGHFKKNKEGKYALSA